jgi:hypothetical protein
LLIQQLGLREDFAALQAARVRLRALEDEAEAALTVLRDFHGEQKFLPGGLPARVLRPVLALLQTEYLWAAPGTGARPPRWPRAGPCTCW